MRSTKTARMYPGALVVTFCLTSIAMKNGMKTFIFVEIVPHVYFSVSYRWAILRRRDDSVGF